MTDQPIKKSAGDRRKKVDPEQAFKLWAALGPTRTYSEVAREMGCEDSTILRMARRMAWDKRLARIEAPQREQDEDELRQLVQEMNARHIEVARVLVTKGIEALQYLEPTSVAEALRLVETGAKLERQARGEPDSKKQITVEAILRERFKELVVEPADQPARPRITVVDVPDLDDDGQQEVGDE